MPQASIDHHPSIGSFNTHNSSSNHSSANYPPTTIASSASVFSRMPLEDVLEDLASRFILNLPIVELSHIERVCFQVEQAHWFYEDFVRPNSLLNLPSYHLKTFTGLFFDKCEFLTASGAPLAGWDPETAYDKFLRYKERVPVCGAIMLNEDATQVLLVRGFKPNSSWSFPRGKINENEQPRDCAIREVLEETGFDIEPYLSLRSIWGDDSRLSALRKARPSNPTPSAHQNNGGLRSHKNCTLRSEGDDHFIEITIREQRLRMYLVAGIPNDTVFQTQTRQEIGRIAWFPLTDLPTFSNTDGVSGKRPISKMINVSSSSVVEPNGQRATSKFYMVVPFVNDMRTWLTNNSFLTPVGHPLSTPRAQEYQRAYVQTPPHLTKNHSHHLSNGNGMAYHENHVNGFASEASAVYERASRLQTFQFSHQDPLSSTPPSTAHDGRMMTSGKKKKKKKNTRRKLAGKKLTGSNEPWTGEQNMNVYLSDQLLSTSEEDEEGVEKAVGDENSPWNDLHEGTRALQNFFFGGQKTSGATADEDDGDAEERSVVLGDEPAFGGMSSLGDEDAHDTASRLKLALFNQAPEPDHRHAIPSGYVPYQGTNPGALHKEVERELEAQIELEYEKEEPMSEADTDVVKGYDIATSYASSLSSSYRGPSTQIPSSDERNSSTHPPHSTNSSNLLSSLLTPHPVNAAEAMYSKHGHLAAPRPQPAPQQVERLLAMLQAPTPGPMSTHGEADESARLLEQLMLGAPAGASAEVALSTPTGRDVRRLAGSTGSEREPTRANGVQQGLTQDMARLGPPLANVLASPAGEPVTPRASNLLDMLMKGTLASQPYAVQHQGQESSSSGALGRAEAGGIRIGMNEEERREKKEGLLRQLQELAVGGLSRGGGGGSGGVSGGGGAGVSGGNVMMGSRGVGDSHQHQHHLHHRGAVSNTSHHLHTHAHHHHHHVNHHPIVID